MNGKSTHWHWKVNDYGYRHMPFSFRAVNAEGSQNDQLYGGFYTGQFWISDSSTDPRGSHTSLHVTHTTPALPTRTPDSSDQVSSPEHRELSPRSKAGIGVGVAISALLIATTAAWLVRRRRRYRQNDSPYLDSKAELQGHGMKKFLPRVAEIGIDGDVFEVQGAARPAEVLNTVRTYELGSGTSNFHEADGNDQKPEMDGGYRGVEIACLRGLKSGVRK